MPAGSAGGIQTSAPSRYILMTLTLYGLTVRDAAFPLTLPSSTSGATVVEPGSLHAALTPSMKTLDQPT